MILKRVALQRVFVFIFTSLLILSGCSSSDSNTEEKEPEETNKDVPLATDDFLTVEENSSAGTLNQEDVSTNDDIGEDGFIPQESTLMLKLVIRCIAKHE